MGYRLPLACVISLLLSFSAGQDTSNCPEYVPEGGTLDCTCLGRCQSSTDRPVLTWPGHNNTDRLVTTSISKQQDGDQFVCQMVCGSQATNTTYTLRVAYGPEVSTSNVSGPLPFITNGTMVMTLTCNAATNPPPEYTWYDVSCDNNNTHSTCSFTPALGDDGKHVECQVTNPKIIPPKKATVGFNFSLHYPPQSPLEWNYSRRFLKAGDTLTCLVTGGKPLASGLNLHCDGSENVSQENERNSTSVSTSITIDLSNNTGENITCFCSWNWTQNNISYTDGSEQTFYTEYSASLTNLTVNGQDVENKSLTFDEGNKTRVTLHCAAYGRPAPYVVLLKDGTEVDRNSIEHELLFSQTVSKTWDAVKCEDTGNYSCVAGNGSSDPEQWTTFLNVQCAPRLDRFDSPGQCLQIITKEGTDLLIVANPSPTPADVHVTYLDTQATQDSHIKFRIELTQVSAFLTRFRVRVQEEDLENLPVDEYRLIVTNSLGKLECTLQRPGQDGPSSAKIGAIAGGAAAGGLLIIFIIIIIVCCKRRMNGKENSKGINKDRQGLENLHFEMEDGGPYHDDDSGIVANGRSSPSDSDPKTDTSLPPRPPSDNAGYANFKDFSAPVHPDGVLRKKNARAAAYDVTSVTSTGKITIKEPAAPQPNAYADPWETEKPFDAILGQGNVSGNSAPGGPPTQVKDH